MSPGGVSIYSVMYRVQHLKRLRDAIASTVCAYGIGFMGNQALCKNGLTTSSRTRHHNHRTGRIVQNLTQLFFIMLPEVARGDIWWSQNYGDKEKDWTQIGEMRTLLHPLGGNGTNHIREAYGLKEHQ